MIDLDRAIIPLSPITPRLLLDSIRRDNHTTPLSTTTLLTSVSEKVEELRDTGFLSTIHRIRLRMAIGEETKEVAFILKTPSLSALSEFSRMDPDALVDNLHVPHDIIPLD